MREQIGGTEMSKTYTLKELADIGAKAAEDECSTMAVSRGHEDFGIDTQAREAFTKAILDAIGYELPKDEEVEAFERWIESHPMRSSNDDLLEAWKAGREELRRSLEVRDARTEQEHAAELAEPAWIPWAGGECPLPDGVEFEFKRRDGLLSGKMRNDGCFRWKHLIQPDDIVAYRVIE
jgi:hypothetical protein